MSSLRITIVFSIAMIILHLKEWDTYKTCPYSFGPLLVTSWATLFLLGLSTELLECEGCVVCGGIFLALSLLSYFIINPILLVMLIMIQLKKQSACLPKSLSFIDNFQIYFNNSLIFLMFCILSIIMIVSYNKKRRMAKMQKEMEAMYTQVLDPKFDIGGFIERNKAMLGEIPFAKKDSVLLADICGRSYPISQEGVNENDRQDCAVCLSSFEKDDRVIDHPKCCHIFHTDCLVHWLEQGNKIGLCPNCKGNTRLQLFEHIAEKRKGRAHQPQSPPVAGMASIGYSEAPQTLSN